MISSARCIQARASIVRCPTVRMPVPTTTSDPALFASLVMPYPTRGNTAAAAAPRTAAVDTPRIAADTGAGATARRMAALHARRMEAALHARRMEAASHARRMGAGASARRMAALHARRMEAASHARRMEAAPPPQRVETPGPVALPRDGRRPSPKHRSLARSYLLPKASQRTSRLRACAGIHPVSVDQSQDLTRTLSDWSPESFLLQQLPWFSL